MDTLDFLKEEYIALRKEIEWAEADLASLERNILLASGAIYAWLATADLRGSLSHWAWYTPVPLVVFGLIRCISIKEQFHHLGEYIKRIEREFSLDNNKYAKGWERFFEEKAPLFRINGIKVQSTTPLRLVFWFALLGITMLVGYCGPDLSPSPDQSNLPTSPTTRSSLPDPTDNLAVGACASSSEVDDLKASVSTLHNDVAVLKSDTAAVRFECAKAAQEARSATVAAQQAAAEAKAAANAANAVWEKIGPEIVGPEVGVTALTRVRRNAAAVPPHGGSWVHSPNNRMHRTRGTAASCFAGVLSARR